MVLFYLLQYYSKILHSSIISPKTILTILLTYYFAYRIKTIQSSEITVSQYKFAYSIQAKKLFSLSLKSY